MRLCVTLSLSEPPFSRPSIPAVAGDMGIAPPPVAAVVGPRRSAALRTPLGRSPVGRPPSGSNVLAGRVKLVSPAPGYPAPTAPAPPPRLPAAPPPAPPSGPAGPAAALSAAAAFGDPMPEK